MKKIVVFLLMALLLSCFSAPERNENNSKFEMELNISLDSIINGLFILDRLNDDFGSLFIAKKIEQNQLNLQYVPEAGYLLKLEEGDPRVLKIGFFLEEFDVGARSAYIMGLMMIASRLYDTSESHDEFVSGIKLCIKVLNATEKANETNLGELLPIIEEGNTAIQNGTFEKFVEKYFERTPNMIYMNLLKK